MTSHSWNTTRERAVEAFGEEPGPALERDLVNVFAEHPAAVLAAVDKVAARYAKGRIRSPWPILLIEARQIETTPDVVADNTANKTKQVKLAETWIRNTGMHYDRFTEIEDELFNDHRDQQGIRGRLKPWEDDPALHQQLEALWSEHRPAGEQIEQEAEDRARAWRQHHKIHQAKAKAAGFGGLDLDLMKTALERNRPRD